MATVAERENFKINQTKERCFKGKWRMIVKVSGCYEIWHSKKYAINLEKIFESMKTQGDKSKRRRIKEETFANLDFLFLNGF